MDEAIFLTAMPVADNPQPHRWKKGICGHESSMPSTSHAYMRKVKGNKATDMHRFRGNPLNLLYCLE
ncbi:MAG: hypothetical protein EBT06_01900 [Gammaproteobacteria bacterium]|nr:hypothetical protein [Gammaproteobacteria bacterium]